MSNHKSAKPKARLGYIGRCICPISGAIAVLATAFGFAGNASALTIRSLAAEIIETSPIVREELHVYRQALQDEQIALAGWLPTIDFNASFGGVQRKAPDTNQRRIRFDRSEAAMTVTQNLFDGFDTSNEVDQARARIMASAYRLVDTADNEVLKGIQAYINVLEQHRLVELAVENVDVHRLILGKIRELTEKGIVRRSDSEQTQARLARANSSLIAQQNNFQDALTTLHRILGRHVSFEELKAPKAPTQVGLSMDGLTDLALQKHPAIEAAQLNIVAARSGYKRAKSPDLPSLDLQLQQRLGIGLDGANERTEEGSLMLNLRYNLYRGGADRAEQRKRASVVQENKSFLDRVRRQVIDTLRLARTAERALQSQLPFLVEDVAKSLETLDLYREEYLLLHRDLIDVLNAEGEVNQARIAEARARFGLLTARYRVEEGLGRLFEALNIGLQLDVDRFKIAGLNPRGIDTDIEDSDLDRDGRNDAIDHCINSRSQAARFGCAYNPPIRFGYGRKQPPRSAPKLNYVPGLQTQFLRFESGGNTLTRDTAPAFDSIIARLTSDRGMNVEVLAHTDSAGSRASNQRLSQQRASRLKQMMIKRGIAPNRIVAAGRGESAPIADNDTAAGRATNRRAEIRFFLPGGPN